MIDIQTVRDAYQSFKVTDVALVRSEFNIADALTKDKAQFILRKSVMNRKVDNLIQLLIICANQGKVSVEKKEGVLF